MEPGRKADSLCRQRAIRSIPAAGTEFPLIGIFRLASVARREAQQNAVPDPAGVIGFVIHGAATHLLNNAIARELERSGLIDDQ